MQPLAEFPVIAFFFFLICFQSAASLLLKFLWLFFLNKELMVVERYGHSHETLPGPSREIRFYGQEVMRFRLILVLLYYKSYLYFSAVSKEPDATNIRLNDIFCRHAP